MFVTCHDNMHSDSVSTTRAVSMHIAWMYACRGRESTVGLLWCPESVWPSAEMWSEAGNVRAMKACVYAGCSRPSPARGKTDTSAAPLAPTLHCAPAPLNP